MNTRTLRVAHPAVCSTAFAYHRVSLPCEPWETPDAPEEPEVKPSVALPVAHVMKMLAYHPGLTIRELAALLHDPEGDAYKTERRIRGVLEGQRRLGRARSEMCSQANLNRWWSVP